MGDGGIAADHEVEIGRERGHVGEAVRRTVRIRLGPGDPEPGPVLGQLVQPLDALEAVQGDARQGGQRREGGERNRPQGAARAPVDADSQAPARQAPRPGRDAHRLRREIRHDGRDGLPARAAEMGQAHQALVAVEGRQVLALGDEPVDAGRAREQAPEGRLAQEDRAGAHRLQERQIADELHAVAEPLLVMHQDGPSHERLAAPGRRRPEIRAPAPDRLEQPRLVVPEALLEPPRGQQADAEVLAMVGVGGIGRDGAPVPGLRRSEAAARHEGRPEIVGRSGHAGRVDQGEAEGGLGRHGLVAGGQQRAETEGGARIVGAQAQQPAQQGDRLRRPGNAGERGGKVVEGIRLLRVARQHGRQGFDRLPGPARARGGEAEHEQGVRVSRGHGQRRPQARDPRVAAPGSEMIDPLRDQAPDGAADRIHRRPCRQNHTPPGATLGRETPASQSRRRRCTASDRKNQIQLHRGSGIGTASAKVHSRYTLGSAKCPGTLFGQLDDDPSSWAGRWASAAIDRMAAYRPNAMSNRVG